MTETYKWNHHLKNSDGSPMSFPQAVTAILVEEREQTQEAADALVNSHPGIMASGMTGGFDYHATASALLMEQSND